VGKLVELEYAMSDVEFPAMRREVLDALAALADAEYQQRVWVRREYPRLDFFDDVKARVNALYDDCQVLPAPESRLWTVLLPGDELNRLRALDRVFSPLIDELGAAPDAAYLADPRWADVTKAAGGALAAMVLAGGYWSA
jgi:hypothetical protein